MQRSYRVDTRTRKAALPDRIRQARPTPKQETALTRYHRKGASPKRWIVSNRYTPPTDVLMAWESGIPVADQTLKTEPTSSPRLNIQTTDLIDSLTSLERIDGAHTTSISYMTALNALGLGSQLGILVGDGVESFKAPEIDFTKTAVDNEDLAIALKEVLSQTPPQLCKSTLIQNLESDSPEVFSKTIYFLYYAIKSCMISINHFSTSERAAIASKLYQYVQRNSPDFLQKGAQTEMEPFDFINHFDAIIALKVFNLLKRPSFRPIPDPDIMTFEGRLIQLMVFHKAFPKLLTKTKGELFANHIKRFSLTEHDMVYGYYVLIVLGFESAAFQLAKEHVEDQFAALKSAIRQTTVARLSETEMFEENTHLEDFFDDAVVWHFANNYTDDFFDLLKHMLTQLALFDAQKIQPSYDDVCGQTKVFNDLLAISHNDAIKLARTILVYPTVPMSWSYAAADFLAKNLEGSPEGKQELIRFALIHRDSLTNFSSSRGQLVVHILKLLNGPTETKADSHLKVVDGTGTPIKRIPQKLLSTQILDQTPFKQLEQIGLDRRAAIMLAQKALAKNSAWPQKRDALIYLAYRSKKHLTASRLEMVVIDMVNHAHLDSAAGQALLIALRLLKNKDYQNLPALTHWKKSLIQNSLSCADEERGYIRACLIEIDQLIAKIKDSKDSQQMSDEQKLAIQKRIDLEVKQSGLPRKGKIALRRRLEREAGLT